MSEIKVAGHYTRGKLEETILQAVARSGSDPNQLTAMDLATVDEFHVGGLEATRELCAQMDLRPGLQVLDVGSGIGGPARYLATEHQCKVTGIDLTEEFVQVARSLTRRTKLDHLVEFVQASALDSAFPAETFDRAYMIHVGMNVADKAGVFREVRRVLKPGGMFVIFDILRSGTGEIVYPVPWASSEETSFVADVTSYRDTLQNAGFRVERERGRRAFGIEFIERMIARPGQGERPALGLHLLMGRSGIGDDQKCADHDETGRAGACRTLRACDVTASWSAGSHEFNSRRQWKERAAPDRLRGVSRIRRRGSGCPLH